MTLVPGTRFGGYDITAGIGEGGMGQVAVAICMATYNPPPALLARQIASIKAQRYGNWVCLISDDHSEPATLAQIQRLVAGDARFRLCFRPDRVGFYRNFERCLEQVPDEADLIALADHDDYWHPDKLEKLIAALKPDDTLVFSDMNIVDEEQRLISNTYWITRRNNYERLADLLVANTVTGAAAVFRRSLLEHLLPFPDPTECSFHDHWIAVVALAAGRLAYVDEPLYDYVQHSRNVIGHAVEREVPGRSPWPSLVRWWDRLRAGKKPDVEFWRDVYLNDVLRLRTVAEAVLLRFGNRLDRKRRTVLRRFAALDRSPAAAAWLAARSVRNLAKPGDTLFAENRLLRGVLWKWLAGSPVPVAPKHSRP